MAARLLTGLGIGGILPNLLAITSMLSTHEQASRNGTLISSAIPIGGGLAGLLIYLAPSDWSWRALLHMGGWVPVVVAGLLAWRIPDLRKDRVEGGSLLDLLSRRQRNVTIPLWLALLSMLMISYVLINWLPTLFRSMGLTGREGGLVMLFFSASGSIAVLLFGWAMKPARTLRTAMLGYAGTLLGIIALALCGPGAGFFTIVAAVSIVSFFQTGAQYLLYGVSSQGYPPALKGTGAGAALGAGRIGAAVGPAVAGLILNTGGSTHLILMAMMPVLAISACSVTVLLKSIYADRSPPRR
jgi:AAHS family 3-hydroxyphenylpropionic acid transporter